MNVYKCIGLVLFGALIIAIPVIVIYLIYFSSSSPKDPYGSGPKIIIDQDGGADDAMAIFGALLYEKYFNGPKVIGITTVFGNVNESQVFLNTQRILTIAGRRDVPIYRGIPRSLVEEVPSDYYFGLDGLGDNDHSPIEALEASPLHASVILSKMSKKYPNEITLVTLGPLTNIALATKLDTDLFERLQHFFVGAGNAYETNNTSPEFNAHLDVEAYHIVAQYSTPDKVTVLPFSTILNSPELVTRDWRENVLGAIPTKIMEAQNSFERLTLPTEETWSMLDPAVIAIVLDNTVTQESQNSYNSIVLCGDDRGVNTNDFSSPDANMNIITSMNTERYKQFLLDVFSAELNN